MPAHFFGGTDNAISLGVVAVLLIFWLLGISLHVAGSLIHLLLGGCIRGSHYAVEPRGLRDWRSDERGELKQMRTSRLRMSQRVKIVTIAASLAKRLPI